MRAHLGGRQRAERAGRGKRVKTQKVVGPSRKGKRFRRSCIRGSGEEGKKLRRGAGEEKKTFEKKESILQKLNTPKRKAIGKYGADTEKSRVKEGLSGHLL